MVKNSFVITNGEIRPANEANTTPEMKKALSELNIALKALQELQTMIPDAQNHINSVINTGQVLGKIKTSSLGHLDVIQSRVNAMRNIDQFKQAKDVVQYTKLEIEKLGGNVNSGLKTMMSKNGWTAKAEKVTGGSSSLTSTVATMLITVFIKLLL
uniref:Shell matrix protein n=1 Tax=Laqueus rubellus TaxID=93892 RepID=A0A3G9CLT5_LAQRU